MVGVEVGYLLVCMWGGVVVYQNECRALTWQLATGGGQVTRGKVPECLWDIDIATYYVFLLGGEVKRPLKACFSSFLAMLTWQHD